MCDRSAASSLKDEPEPDFTFTLEALTKIMRKFYQKLIDTGVVFQSLLLLAMRLYWGKAFFLSGWSKMHSIDKVTLFFENLHIPFPALNAYLVGSMECAGGLCLLIGLASRLVSIPLAITMLVALFTAHHDSFVHFWTDFDSFSQEAPFLYLLTSLIVFAFGPGKISIDALLKRVFFRTR